MFFLKTFFIIVMNEKLALDKEEKLGSFGDIVKDKNRKSTISQRFCVLFFFNVWRNNFYVNLLNFQQKLAIIALTVGFHLRRHYSSFHSLIICHNESYFVFFFLFLFFFFTVLRFSSFFIFSNLWNNVWKIFKQSLS